MERKSLLYLIDLVVRSNHFILLSIIVDIFFDQLQKK